MVWSQLLWKYYRIQCVHNVWFCNKFFLSNHFFLSSILAIFFVAISKTNNEKINILKNGMDLRLFQFRLLAIFKAFLCKFCRGVSFEAIMVQSWSIWAWCKKVLLCIFYWHNQLKTLKFCVGLSLILVNS